MVESNGFTILMSALSDTDRDIEKNVVTKPFRYEVFLVVLSNEKDGQEVSPY